MGAGSNVHVYRPRAAAGAAVPHGTLAAHLSSKANARKEPRCDSHTCSARNTPLHVFWHLRDHAQAPGLPVLALMAACATYMAGSAGFGP